jgi:hypothetical protein
MKAISIKQPWAWAIIYAGKDIENRTWGTKHRGRILIHASSTIDRQGYLWLMERHWGRLPDPDQLETGGIIGAVDIVGCVRQHPSRWFFGPFGFVLQNPISYSLVEMKGKLGIWEVDIPFVPEHKEE